MGDGISYTYFNGLDFMKNKIVSRSVNTRTIVYAIFGSIAIWMLVFIGILIFDMTHSQENVFINVRNVRNANVPGRRCMAYTTSPVGSFALPNLSCRVDDPDMGLSI